MRRKTRKPFGLSRIKAKKIPQEFRSKGVGKSPPAITKSGEVYWLSLSRLVKSIHLHNFSREQQSTIKAFCRNYFAKNRELPTVEQLETVFPYLKKEK